MGKVLKIPSEALLVDCQFAAEHTEEQSSGSRAFKGKANSGEVIADHWFWGNFAIDMAGLKVPRKDIPVMLDHLWPIGFTNSIEKSDKGLDVEGMVLDANQKGQETLAFMERGMPFQMSVYVPPDRTGIEKIEEGQTAEVNGRKLKGPGHIFRKSTLREVTITALGADQRTSAALLSERGVHQVEVELEEPMTKTEKLTAASLKEEHPAVFAEIANSAHADGVTKGVEQERSRISFINGKSKGVKPELVQQAIAEGWDEQKTLSAFFDYVSEHKDARISQLRDEHGEDNAHGSDDPDAEFRENEGSGDDAIEKMADGEARWKAEFEAKPELQDEFGDVDTYVYYKRHPESRRQKRHREHAAG